MFFENKNSFSQQPFGTSITGSYNGWLYHLHNVTIGGYIEPKHTLLIYSDSLISFGGGQINTHTAKNNLGSKSLSSNKGYDGGLSFNQNVGFNALQVANSTTGHNATDGVLLGNIRKRSIFKPTRKCQFRILYK